MEAQPEPSEASAPPELVIITGLSGSGKGTVLRVFEDLGYYAVDNLPVALIPTFVALVRQSQEIQRAALVVDIREGQSLSRFPEIYREIKAEAEPMLVFLEAGDDILQRRFSETRRPHPLGGLNTVLENVQRERERLAPIAELADMTIDTSRYSIHDLRRLIVQRFGEPESRPVLLVSVQSFGFKHGAPTDCDLLFDVRFLPNPHYLPGGKDLTGQDAKVIEYVGSFPQTQEFIDKTCDLLVYLLPYYAAEGKSYLTVGIGCTGGRHRSVMIAEEIARRIGDAGYEVKLVHRDLHRQP